MIVEKRRLVVAAAIAAIEVQTSGNTVSASKPGLPSGEYGYLEWSFSGKKRWSESRTPWKPASSAARASGTSCSGSVKERTCQNLTRPASPRGNSG